MTSGDEAPPAVPSFSQTFTFAATGRSSTSSANVDGIGDDPWRPAVPSGEAGLAQPNLRAIDAWGRNLFLERPVRRIHPLFSILVDLDQSRGRSRWKHDAKLGE